jgi:hypothetical protein
LKTLYFDIDGTVVRAASSRVKPALGGGALEAAVRAAGIERLVCVGSFVTAARLLMQIERDYDPLGAILDLCRGAFVDHTWFRGATDLVADADERVSGIDMATDWWYVDDLAAYFFTRAGRQDVYAREQGRRVYAPRPDGDGKGILEWLDAVVRAGVGNEPAAGPT